MKIRSFLVGAAVLAGVSLAPSQASAQCGVATYSVTNLGLGGALTGCFNFTLTELGENAGITSQQYYWAGNFSGPSGAAPSNAPTPAGTFFFDDNCGSNGSTGFANFRFCTGAFAVGHSAGPISNLSGELVFGLDVPDPWGNLPAFADYWVYSGAPSRNAYPSPAGYQQVLYQLTLGGVPLDGEYLFGWEDLNTGCTGVSGSILHPSLQYYAFEDLGDAQKLDDPNNCNQGNPNPADGDYNDSYFRISITGGTLSTTPEPMTMTLMATGLVGLAGAQIRRRRKQS